ncbi:hypothetical protein GQ457_15G012780 [Hibiscus cannabinus]
MGFQHRRLMSDSPNETSATNCSLCYEYCVSTCYDFCPDLCPSVDPPSVDPFPPPTPSLDSGSHSDKPNNSVIVVSTLLAAAFLALCCLVYYARRRANARRRSSQADTAETRDEFLFEDHGPIVDHPIWYINTVGLQPSIIRSIAVCKYKRGEGLVEGTECSVCLNEFQEDEALRLLPKCSHAFHIPCIDNWLRSHTNCPMCRAPIVSDARDTGPSSSSEVNDEHSRGAEETQVVIVEESESGTSETAGGNEGNEGENCGTEDGIQPVRRSVSLDSMAASRISHDLVNGDSDNELGKGQGASVRIVPRRAVGNRNLQRWMCQSSIGSSCSSKSEPVSMKRSFSCSGKFTLPISNGKSRDANPPLRSF